MLPWPYQVFAKRAFFSPPNQKTICTRWSTPFFFSNQVWISATFLISTSFSTRQLWRWFQFRYWENPQGCSFLSEVYWDSLVGHFNQTQNILSSIYSSRSKGRGCSPWCWMAWERKQTTTYTRNDKPLSSCSRLDLLLFPINVHR